METRKIRELWPVLNPFRHDYYVDSQMDNLMTSIQANGIQKPLIITEENRILDGKLRWIAASRLGMDEVPVEVWVPKQEAQPNVPVEPSPDIGTQEDESAFFDMEDEP